MLALENCNKPGILLVLTRPTSPRYISEIEDWYDTEHGPARLRLGKEYFSRGCRFRLVSDSSTAWLAMYEMRSLSAGARDPYTSLRTNRSLREQEIFRGKLEVRSRRFLKSLADSGSTSRTADMIYVISFEASGQEVQLSEWYCKDMFDIFAKVHCSRSRLFQLVDGTHAEEDRAFFVGIHEFETTSEHLKAAEMVQMETRVRGQNHVLRCSRMQAFSLEKEFSALDYQPPRPRDRDRVDQAEEQTFSSGSSV